EPAEAELVLRKGEPLEGAVGRMEHDRGRGLVDLPALDANEAVLDVVDPTDAVTPGQRVEPLDELDRVDGRAVEADRGSAIEPDGHLDGRRRICRRARP